MLSNTRVPVEVALDQLNFPALHIIAVPAFETNYIWLIHDGVHAVVVDPGKAQPVLAILNKLQLTLTAILLTHHHEDHIGGVLDIVAKHPAPVYGPGDEDIKSVSVPVHQDSMVTLDRPALAFSVIEVPGHTRGHLAYFSSEQHWLFCGDTLFAGGCGRLFEGSARQMAASLKKLKDLPGRTTVFCAHEYTISNLKFAMVVDPDNQELAHRMQLEKSKREQGLPTVPSTMALETSTNPFLRIDDPDVITRVVRERGLKRTDPVSIFSELRAWKDGFAG